MNHDPTEQEAWMTDAACAHVSPDMWFPLPNEPRARAVRICETCPVRKQCLEYALVNDERFGIWGGLYGRELQRVRKAERTP